MKLWVDQCLLGNGVFRVWKSASLPVRKDLLPSLCFSSISIRKWRENHRFYFWLIEDEQKLFLFPLLTTFEYSLRQSGFLMFFNSSIRWHDHLTDSIDLLNDIHHFRYVTIPNRPVVKANPWSHFFERVDNHTRRCELHNIKKKNEAPKKSYWKNMLASKTVFLTMHPTMTWYL